VDCGGSARANGAACALFCDRQIVENRSITELVILEVGSNGALAEHHRAALGVSYDPALELDARADRLHVAAGPFDAPEGPTYRYQVFDL
jgi:hypothetical protein